MWHQSTHEHIASDYKGGLEYQELEGSTAYASGADAITMITDFYDFFTEVRNKRIRLCRHDTLYVEEWMGILSYASTQSKTMKAELLGKVAEILAVGRDMNIGIILSIQRADSGFFEGSTITLEEQTIVIQEEILVVIRLRLQKTLFASFAQIEQLPYYVLLFCCTTWALVTIGNLLGTHINLTVTYT